MIKRISYAPFRGGRLIKKTRGVISIAVSVGGAVLISASMASADCLTPETTNDMCDLGSLSGPSEGGSAVIPGGISADGSVIIGTSAILGDITTARAVIWDENGTRIRDLGTLHDENEGTSSALAVSSNGLVIVGVAQDNDGYARAFRWLDDGEGMRALGDLGNGRSQAIAVSEDGTVIAGVFTDSWAGGSSGNVFRWSEDLGMQNIGSLRDDNLDNRYNESIKLSLGEEYSEFSLIRTLAGISISPSGDLIVGTSLTNDYSERAFLWVDPGTGVDINEGMSDLGSLQGDNEGNSVATFVAGSASQAVVVGQAENDDGEKRAFRWANFEDGMQDLGTLREDNSGDSFATQISRDGSTIVGTAQATGIDADSVEVDVARAFRWTNSEDGMQDLGTLRDQDDAGQSEAWAVSDDGAVVVGLSDANDDQYAIFGRAYKWTEDGGMEDLGTLRSDDLGFSVATAVSGDGSVISGMADTEDDTMRAFIFRTQMQDLENLQRSFPILSNDTEIAVSQQQNAVGRLMDVTCFAEEEQSCFRADGWLSNTSASNSDDIGERSSQSITLTYGYGLDEKTTIGGTLSIGGTNLNNNGFDLDNGLGVSLWTEYSESGLARTGWQAGAALGHVHGGGDISRGRGIENVMLSTGAADLSTTGARATLGYGFQQEDWLLTPSATLSHFNTSRSAYTETGGDFNAAYEELSMSRTSLALEFNAERKISETGTLLLGIGVEHDISIDQAVLIGTSDMLGMESFSAPSTLERNDTRGFATVGYTHDLGNNRALTGSLQVEQAAYGNAPQVSAGIGVSMRF